MAVAINYLSLFTGHGGLDIGFRLGCEALGIVARCVGYVEREAYAASCLLGRMEESALERAPVFCGDIRDVRGREFRGIENLWVIGGFPCQDISFAGKGAGIVEGNRSGLWFEYARIIEESGAVGVFAENVAAIIGRGLDLVLQDLARLGFDAEWDRFTASQVGAPHKRERWFCMASHAGQRGQQRRLPEGRRQEGLRAPDAERRREDMADTTRRGQRERGQPSQRDRQPDGRHETLDDSAGPRCDKEGQRTEAVHGSGQRLSGAGRDQLANAGCAGDERRHEPGGVGSVQSPRESEGHQRQRAWRDAGDGSEDMANPTYANRGGRISGEEEGTGPGESGRRGLAGGCADVEHAESSERRPENTEREALGRVASGRASAGGHDVGNTEGSRHEGRSGIGRSADERLFESPSAALFPPGPGDREAWERIVADDSLAFLRPAVEPGVRVLDDGLALVVDESRADQLRGGGNGVVPLQAAYAFVQLARRIGLA